MLGELLPLAPVPAQDGHRRIQTLLTLDRQVSIGIRLAFRISRRWRWKFAEECGGKLSGQGCPCEAVPRTDRWHRQIRFVDVQVAVASGLPPLIAAGSFDVKTVHEGPEAALSRPLSGPASESQTILGIFLAGRIDYLLLGSKTLHMVHSASFGKTELRQVLDMIQELFTELEFRRRRILVIQETLASTYPSADNQDDLVKLSESNPRLARFTQTLLAMLKFKPYTVLYGQARRHGLFDYLMEQEPE